MAGSRWPQGWGKSTAGRIEVLGRDVLALGEGDLRKLRAAHIGMVFQHMALFPHRTVRDNVAFPLWAGRTRSEPHRA